MFHHSPQADLSTLASRAAQQAMPRRGSMVTKLEARATPAEPLPAAPAPKIVSTARPTLTVLSGTKPTPKPTLLTPEPAPAESVDSTWAVAASRIVVVGTGGAGGNAVARMVDQPTENFDGIRFAVANTDAQALAKIDCDLKVTLGPKVTKGLGAGGKTEIGAQAAEESLAAIHEMIGDADLVFITLGLGGGTGSGAAPVIARVAREKGAVVVAIATLPFAFEGTQRSASAERALDTLRACSDTVVVVNNNALFSLFEKGKQNASLAFAFSVADQCLQQAVDGMVGIIRHPGTINLDFADVRATLAKGGRGYFGMGVAEGDHAAARAMEKAMNSQLLGSAGVSGAKKVLVYFRGEAAAADIAEAMNRLDALLDLECETFFGCGSDAELGDQVEVTLFAVGVVDGPPNPQAVAILPPKPRPQEPIAASAAPVAASVAIPLPAFTEPAGRFTRPEPAARAAKTVAAQPEPIPAPRREPASVPAEAKPATPVRPARITDSDLPPFLVRGREIEERGVKHSYHLTSDQSDHSSLDDLDVPAFLRRRGQR